MALILHPDRFRPKALSLAKYTQPISVSGEELIVQVPPPSKMRAVSKEDRPTKSAHEQFENKTECAPKVVEVVPASQPDLGVVEKKKKKKKERTKEIALTKELTTRTIVSEAGGTSLPLDEPLFPESTNEMKSPTLPRHLPILPVSVPNTTNQNFPRVLKREYLPTIHQTKTQLDGAFRTYGGASSPSITNIEETPDNNSKEPQRPRPQDSSSFISTISSGFSNMGAKKPWYKRLRFSHRLPSLSTVATDYSESDSDHSKSSSYKNRKSTSSTSAEGLKNRELVWDFLRRVARRDYLTRDNQENLAGEGHFVTSYVIKGGEHYRIPYNGQSLLWKSKIEDLDAAKWWKEFAFLSPQEIASLNAILGNDEEFLKTLLLLKWQRKSDLQFWSTTGRVLIAVVANIPIVRIFY